MVGLDSLHSLWITRVVEVSKYTYEAVRWLLGSSIHCGLQGLWWLVNTPMRLLDGCQGAAFIVDYKGCGG